MPRPDRADDSSASRLPFPQLFETPRQDDAAEFGRELETADLELLGHDRALERLTDLGRRQGQ